MSVRPRRVLLLRAALLAAAAGFVASPASAQQLANAPVDLQIFRPAMDSKGFITLNSSGVLGQLDFSFGLVTTYARKPLSFTGTGTFGGQPNAFSIDNLVTPSLQGAIGLYKSAHLGLELGMVIPMAIVGGHGSPNNPPISMPRVSIIRTLAVCITSGGRSA